MRYILVLLVALHIAYAKEIPSYAKEWQGIYKFTQKTSKQAFKISDNCFDDEDMGGFVCEIGYSKNNSAFDDFAINFYTEKPNDMNYSIVRIISLQSPTKATIKVFSMEYNNDFCNIEVIRQGQMITLVSGSCKIEDFTLHKDIFNNYLKSHYTSQTSPNRNTSWAIADYPKGTKRISNGKQSYYEDIGGNKMLITYERIIQALKDTKQQGGY